MSEAASLFEAQIWPYGNQMIDQKSCCVSVFIAVFDKQVNIHCSIDSISRSISSRKHNEPDKKIAMDIYQSYFRKLDIFFTGKQQGAVMTEQKIYSLIYDSCMAVIIFKVAAPFSIFLRTRLSWNNKENK